ncbi:MAG: transcription termination/antitermination NusG family protein [bacterium]
MNVRATSCNRRWPPGRTLEADLGYWKLARIRSRNEKALARDCEAAGIAFYLPLYIKRTRRRDNNKPRQSLLPLFPGYFPFVAREDHQRLLLETGRVVQIMEIPDQRRFADNLRQIWNTLESGTAILGVEPIAPGQNVRIKEGPLAGMTGIVKEVRGQHCLLLAVEAFQMAVCVQTGRLEVEVIQ